MACNQSTLYYFQIHLPLCNIGKTYNETLFARKRRFVFTPQKPRINPSSPKNFKKLQKNQQQTQMNLFKPPPENNNIVKQRS